MTDKVETQVTFDCASIKALTKEDRDILGNHLQTLIEKSTANLEEQLQFHFKIREKENLSETRVAERFRHSWFQGAKNITSPGTSAIVRDLDTGEQRAARFITVLEWLDMWLYDEEIPVHRLVIAAFLLQITPESISNTESPMVRKLMTAVYDGIDHGLHIINLPPIPEDTKCVMTPHMVRVDKDLSQDEYDALAKEGIQEEDPSAAKD